MFKSKNLILAMILTLVITLLVGCRDKGTDGNLVLKSLEAVNLTTIEATFNDGTVKKVKGFKVGPNFTENILKDGENTIKYTYRGVSYEGTVNASVIKKYLYTTDKRDKTMLEGITISPWEYSNQGEVTYEAYKPCLKASRGEWVVQLQFSGEVGIFDGYDILEFKIKADEPQVKVVFDNTNKIESGEGYNDHTITSQINLTKDGMDKRVIPLEEDGWYKVTINLSTLDADKIASAKKLLFRMDSGRGYAAMHVTDISLKGLASKKESVDKSAPEIVTLEDNNTDYDVKNLDLSNEGVSIFPRAEKSWVGDPMPYYDGEDFQVFYLEDLRHVVDIGYHPWSLLTTNDFLQYKDEGIVIPYTRDRYAQDFALGTGSVIKDKDGLYHAFYTGHNSKRMVMEVVMHATSKDLKNWTKIPEDTFQASSQYNPDDFRDPYVFYNEDYEQYWMLITTRKDNMGVIALYTSGDLKDWTDEGVFFSNDMGSDSNMECPTLIKYGQYWYLTFSDQWPKRVVHYRIAKDSKGTFKKPTVDYFDGNGFYAGRMEKDSENLYMFGWTPTKKKYDDAYDYNWAGNLVVHQIKQKENGELYPTPIKQVVNKISNKVELKPLTKTKEIKVSQGNYFFSGSQHELVTFSQIQGISKIIGKITTKSQINKFGFMFNVSKDGIGSLNMVFDSKSQELQFYNVATDKIKISQPQSTMPLQIEKNDTLDFTLLIDDSVAVLYVNDEAVLSTRMFSIQNNQWGIFSMDSKITVEDLKLSK